MGTMQPHPDAPKASEHWEYSVDRNYDQWELAACLSPTPQDRMKYGWDLMYPKGEGGKRTRQEYHVIKTYCRRCPLLQYCKQQGKSEEFGVWGGESEDTRRANREWVRFFAA